MFLKVFYASISTSIFTLTIYLEINESWAYNQIITINLNISLYLLFPEYLSRIDNFSSPDPEIVFDEFAISQ